ncbi:MAG: hypothetical protein LPK20_01550, partial [Halomonas sp.]|nr:hypothetical protein [Halomonas sp.]
MKAQPPHHSSPTASRSEPSPSPVERFRRADDPEWHWLEDRDDAQVQAYLEEANEESKIWMRTLESLDERLY